MGQVDRTLPTDGVSPCDFYDGNAAPSRALGFFSWNLSGTTLPAADAMVVLDLNDASTTTAGSIKCLYIDIDVSGEHASGSKWIDGVAIDMSITDTYYRYLSAIDIYWEITSGKGAKNNYGIYMYFADMGAGTVDAIIPLGIDREITAATNAGDWDCFARFVTHGSGYATTIFSFEGYPYIATNLFHFEHAVAPISTSATALSGITTAYKIAVKAGTTTGYIPVVVTGMS